MNKTNTENHRHVVLLSLTSSKALKQSSFWSSTKSSSEILKATIWKPRWVFGTETCWITLSLKYIENTTSTVYGCRLLTFVTYSFKFMAMLRSLLLLSFVLRMENAEGKQDIYLYKPSFCFKRLFCQNFGIL